MVLALAASTIAALPVSIDGSPALEDEFVGPFSSWVNVRTACGAKGDGIADASID